MIRNERKRFPAILGQMGWVVLISSLAFMGIALAQDAQNMGGETGGEILLMVPRGELKQLGITTRQKDVFFELAENRKVVNKRSLSDFNLRVLESEWK